MFERQLAAVGQQALGRHDRALAFDVGPKTAGGGLRVGVQSNKAAGGMAIEILREDTYGGLIELGDLLKGLAGALQAQHAIALEDAAGERQLGTWQVPALATPQSLMLAVYPGSGAHYVRHVDNDPEDVEAQRGPPGQRICDREITAILYLNQGAHALSFFCAVI
ncbi:hypothetical protein CYMTET_33080 [Cymbomonas tetramitiformis]|uniref:Uncharacterized protein n=1 Tax=Cymbomonas tetramitiformis TaxID=36881 RepID=A0AAE0FEE6_9CHLO|nr:hypothetical protein CYMTET_33080 [Cymbomonas tetramitiformis]